MRDLTKIQPTTDNPSIVLLTRMDDDGTDEIVDKIGVDLNWHILRQFLDLNRHEVFDHILHMIANEIATEMPFQIRLTGANDVMEVWGFE